MERGPQGIHKDRVFDGQELPNLVEVRLAENLSEVGQPVNGVSENILEPTTKINGLPAIWYPHSHIPKKERHAVNYQGLDEFGNPVNRIVIPSGWILTEHVWLPITIRLLRIMPQSEIGKNPTIFDRVKYNLNGGEVNLEHSGTVLTSLGAADNEYFVNYSETFGRWLVMDQASVGYKSCGVGKRVYGAGCYFGGFWTCADKASAKKVDDIVCKTKNPPWPTKYFMAVIDDIVYNAGLGSSIKSGRIKLLGELPELK